jgi:hypothetical protein
MESYWFGDREGQVCRSAPKDSGLLAERIELLIGTANVSIPNWRVAVQCGFVSDRSEYLRVLQEAAINLVFKNLEWGYQADQSGLIQMVRMLE